MAGKGPQVTPVMLAKKWDIRPQMIFNWVKQGCPSYRSGGKTFVIESEVEAWRSSKDKERKEKKERQQLTKGGITPEQRELIKLLGAFKAQRIKGMCENHSENEQVFIVDINYASTEWFGCYVSAWCFECGLNHRFQDDVPEKIAEEILRGERELWVPVSGRFADQFPELAKQYAVAMQAHETESVLVEAS
jgi:hypothetical protein